MLSRNINFIVNKSEITAGTRGSSLGPEAVITVSRSRKTKFFGNFKKTFIKDENDFLDQESIHQFAKNIEGYEKVFNEVEASVINTFEANEFPFILAGDHGSAAATISGIKRFFSDKRLGVVWIDAHGDIHSPYTTPSGNMHGMPLSIALAQDNLEYKRNNLPIETKEIWDALKTSGGITPKILAEDLVYVAVRDVEEEEVSAISKLNIRNFSVEEVNKFGADKISELILQKLQHCDLIYISFDVDSMDPELTSFGTGTPVNNGLKPNDAETILLNLTKSEKCACVEFVEINPCLDEKKNKMAEVAYDFIEKIVNQNFIK